MPLLQQRVDDQVATGDHDGGQFASSEVHWSHASRDHLEGALCRDREARGGNSEIGVSKYKLSVSLPGAEGGVHVFSDEEEADGAPLSHVGLLDNGLTLRLEEHPHHKHLEPGAVVPPPVGLTQSASAGISVLSTTGLAQLGQGVRGALSLRSQSSAHKDVYITLKVALADATGDTDTPDTPHSTNTMGETPPPKPSFLEVEVQPSDSLLSLKDKVGVLLMNFQAGWTVGSQERALLELESSTDSNKEWPVTSAAAMAMTSPKIPANGSGDTAETDSPLSLSLSPSPEGAVPLSHSWRLREGNFLREKKQLLQEFSWPGTESRKDVKSASSSSSSASASTSTLTGSDEGTDINSCDTLHSCIKLQTTVAAAGLRGGSVVLLERGVAPVAGLSRYPLSTGRRHHVTTSSGPQLGASPGAAAFFTALTDRRRYLQRVGFVLVHESMLSASFRRVVWAKCKSAAVSVTPNGNGEAGRQHLGPPDQESFRIRELRSDCSLVGLWPTRLSPRPLPARPSLRLASRTRLAPLAARGCLLEEEKTLGGGKGGKNNKKDSMLSWALWIRS